MTETLRVATLNLWGQRGDWAARRRVLAAGFARLNADLVAFQDAIVINGTDQVREILGGDYHVVHQREREGDGQGVSIASRYPVHGRWEVDLAVTPRASDSAVTTLVIQVDAPPPFGPVLFANHFPSWQLPLERERELQAVAAARSLEAAIAGRHRHVVIAGDLDADPEAASMRFWTGRQSLDGFSVCYRDAWASAHPGEPGGTYVPDNPLLADWDWPFRRIDYILARCGEHGGPTLAVSSCERIFDKPADGVWASDHFGLTADLTVPPAGL
jgi:endonuclease/exonuclease/phosphatase family metal-dependent hydrolase